MLGHVFEVIDSPTAIRYFLVAIDDVDVSAYAVTGVGANRVEIESHPFTQVVRDYLGIANGQIHRRGLI